MTRKILKLAPTPRTEALLDQITQDDDAIDWQATPTDTQLLRVVEFCRGLERELTDLQKQARPGTNTRPRQDRTSG